MNYYSAMKKNEILPFGTTWIDLEGIMLSEIRQAEKDKYHMISLIHGYQKKKNMDKQNGNKLIDTEHILMVARGEEGRRWVKNMKGNKRVRLPVKK